VVTVTGYKFLIDERDDALAKDVEQEVRNRTVKRLADQAIAQAAYEEAPPIDLAVVEYQPIEYLIPHYMPRTLTLVVAEEGAGKGLMGVWAAKQQLDARRRVLFLSTEDVASEMKGRLEAAGWKPKPNMVFHLTTPRSMDYLAMYIRMHKIGFVVFDALRDFMPTDGRGGSHNDDAFVRPAVRKVVQMLEETHAAGFGNHHTNKATLDSNGKPLTPRQQMQGSMAFLQGVRHAIMLTRNADGAQVFGIFKSNIHKRGGYLRSYELIEATNGVAKFEPGPADEFPVELSLYDWQKHADPDGASKRTYDESRELVIAALKETATPDGKLWGADRLHTAKLKEQGVTKATVTAVIQELRDDGVIVGADNAVKRWAA
jgi:hypothetical protein